MLRTGSRITLPALILALGAPAPFRAGESDRSTPARLEPLPPLRGAAADPRLRAALALQIALETHGFSPGLLDGAPGPRTRVAIAAFQSAAGLKPDGEAGPETLALLGVEPDRAIEAARVRADDPADVDPPPRDWIERSRRRRLLFPSLLNLMAERTHTTERLLASLNPGLEPARLAPGSLLWAPAVDAGRRKSLPVDRVEIVLERKLILLFSGGGGSEQLIGLLHCSIAADPAQAPHGDAMVLAVAANPVYTFDPAKWPEVRGVARKLQIPPGPRSPVGLRWIGLDRDGIGIHGASEPENVGRTGSHGCFRLTNWDAVWLADLVRVGTRVRIVKGARESSWPWAGVP